MASSRRLKRLRRNGSAAMLPSQVTRVDQYGGPRTPQKVPAALAGRFVAWSPDGLQILGSGLTIDEARANAGGSARLIFQKVPPPGALRGGIATPATQGEPVAT